MLANDKLGANSAYYSHLRLPLLALAQKKVEAVLDVGCASGAALNFFAERGATRLVGVEVRKEVAMRAQERLPSADIKVGGVEEVDLDAYVGAFDLIIVSFVLEHVADPWAVLEKLKTLLKPGGRLIGSLPNVRYVGVSVPLLIKGQWRYVDDGVLDWTHLRFFTRSTILDLLREVELAPLAIEPEIDGLKAKTLNGLSLGLLRDFAAYAYNFSATTSDVERVR